MKLFLITLAYRYSYSCVQKYIFDPTGLDIHHTTTGLISYIILPREIAVFLIRKVFFSVEVVSDGPEFCKNISLQLKRVAAAGI